MTVLAISLLRLGDLILQRPLLEGLRRKHPKCEIHILINKQFSQAEFLFEGLVDRFIYFDRESLQKSCGENQYSIFWGYRALHALVEEINKTSYAAVYNLTHNRMTAHIAGLIPTELHYGIYSRGGDFFGLTNPWIRFFNSYFGRAEATGFHYTELLAAALEISLETTTLPAAESLRETILIQPLTSDQKKNWSLQKYRLLAETLQAETTFKVQVLGAPFEQEVLQKEIAPQFLKICSLEEAALLLKSAALLITGDTSIKHLAAIYKVPILELSLGSSQPLQVGAYTDNSIILQSRAPCGPCPHSVPCPQARHICGDEISAKAVTEAALLRLRREPQDWRSYAHLNPDLRVFRTEILPVIGWTVECLSVGDKNKFDEVLQQKTMIVEDLNRRHQANKGASHEYTERTRKVPDRSPEAS
jgi:ADP-heptose:LPS heptosyltransferase